MKKFILTLILAVLICGQAFAATVSKSFTATGAGGVLSVKVGDSFTYSVSGTFAGTWVLQSSADGVSTWQTVATGTAASGGTVLAESRGSDHLSYRMYCEAYTSGTIVTTMTDETGYSVPITEFKNKNGVTVAHTTENGFVVDGSFTGGTEDGAVTYNVKSQFGAKGDGIQLLDGNVTSATTAFTSLTAAFKPEDVGKVITIVDAGGTNIDLTTTIAAYVSPTAVTLATAASATVADVPFTYGTDDTNAIRAAIAAIDAQTGIGKSGTIFFPDGTYIVNGAFDQVDNSQIGLPTNAFANPTITIRFLGVLSGANSLQDVGTTIFGTRYGTDGTYSIISGRNSGQTGDITRVNAVFENIRFRTVQNPTHSGLDLLDVDTASGKNVTFDHMASYTGSLIVPTHSDSYAIKMPGTLTGNASGGGWQGLKIKTYYNAILAGEHTLIHDVFITTAVNAFVFSDCRYPVVVNYAAVEISLNVLKFTGAVPNYVLFNQLDIEHRGTGLFQSVLDIDDTGNLGIGQVNYTIFVVDGGLSTIQVDGGIGVARNNVKVGNREVRAASGDAFRVIGTMADSSTSGGSIFALQNDGTAVGSGSRLGFIGFGGLSNVANTYVYGAAIQGLSAEAFTSTAAGTHMQFRTVPTGSTTNTERMRITSQGNIGMGTTTPTALLQVGTAAATAFQISTSGGITSAGNVGISTVAPTSCLCKTYTNGICTLLASCI